MLIGGIALNHEDPRLLQFDQEQRLVLILCLYRQRERHFVCVSGDLPGAGPDIQLGLRGHPGCKDIRRLRRLEREILDVDLLQHQLLGCVLGLVLFCHDFLKCSVSLPGSVSPAKRK